MNAKDAWLATLGQLQVQLNRSTYDAWLRRAELLGYEDGRFVVTVPNAYVKDWLERYLLEAMTQTLSRIFGRPSEIQVIVWSPVDQESAIGPLFDFAAEEPPFPEGENRGMTLNPECTFAHFVVGEANRYPFLLAQAIVEGQIGKYSPSFFHGKMGVGKTHLLQAIAHALLEQGYAVVYITAEDFTNALVEAIQGRQNPAFREKYRTADAVIIDDLQFIEGKESTQAELVAIWDALRNRQRAMIFAADRFPRDMARISHDARSRFQAGPIAIIEPPDLALREAILKDKMGKRAVFLPADVLELLAAQITSNVRDLEGAIEQLCTYSRLTGQSITVSTVRKALHWLETLSATEITLEKVLAATADYYKVPVKDLASRCRTRLVVRARQLAMYLARELTTASLPQIGEALGGRNHSTVMHGCARVVEMLAVEPNFAAEVADIKMSFGLNNGVEAIPVNKYGYRSST